MGGSDGLGLGVKLQRFESQPSPPLHHHYSHMVHDGGVDQSRPFPDVYSVVAVPLQQQPFDISAAALHHHHHHLSAFKSPGSGTMGTSVGLGFPFTDAQWKELQRQGMVYKYMMASVPVPPDLLLSDPTTAPPLGGGFKLRFSGGADPEPGRCRRTDGKKWRCSKDAAPDQKYCERHLHRGRPRSRKPVEHQVNPKKTKTKTKTSHSTLTLPIPTPLTSDASNPTISSGINGFGTAQNIMVFGRSGERDHTTMDHVPRGLEWMMMNQNQNHSHHTDLNFCEEDNEQSHRFGLAHPNDLKLPLSSLELSMGGSIGNNTIEHETGRIQTGSGFSGPSRTHHHWMSLGGPLAEVLRPSNSNIAEESSNLSSPSGVLQKAALVSLSDSSGSSSPTTFSMPLPMQWLSHQRQN